MRESHVDRPSLTRRPRQFSIGALLGLIAAIAFLVAIYNFLEGRNFGPREASPRTICVNNLANIAKAVLQYHEHYGSLPTAYTVDDKGRPLHSWRTLILPFIERRDVYKALKLDEPWNSPHNAAVFSSISLDVLHCPSDKLRFPGVTNFVAVVGPGTAWPGSTSENLDHIKSSDGESTTILLVEVANSDIHWAEPRDLTLADIQKGFNPMLGLGISSRHPNVVNVTFCNGRTLALSTSTSQATLQALLTVAGKELIVEGEYGGNTGTQFEVQDTPDTK